MTLSLFFNCKLLFKIICFEVRSGFISREVSFVNGNSVKSISLAFKFSEYSLTPSFSKFKVLSGYKV